MLEGGGGRASQPGGGRALPRTKDDGIRGLRELQLLEGLHAVAGDVRLPLRGPLGRNSLCDVLRELAAMEHQHHAPAAGCPGRPLLLAAGCCPGAPGLPLGRASVPLRLPPRPRLDALGVRLPVCAGWLCVWCVVCGVWLSWTLDSLLLED
jgi:hypothetical protein